MIINSVYIFLYYLLMNKYNNLVEHSQHSCSNDGTDIYSFRLGPLSYVKMVLKMEMCFDMYIQKNGS